MKQNFTTYLIILLALIVANTGFARADAQLCQTSCEYVAVNNTAPPPCCKSKKTANPVMVMAGHDESIPSDCPHVGSSREITDTLTFISTSNPLPAPVQPAVLATILPPMPDIPDTRFSGYALRAGLSPPGWKSLPVYRLNCSLLI